MEGNSGEEACSAADGTNRKNDSTSATATLTDLKGFGESLAMTLLNSTDEKVVAAARRIFFNTPSQGNRLPVELAGKIQENTSDNSRNEEGNTSSGSARTQQTCSSPLQSSDTSCNEPSSPPSAESQNEAVMSAEVAKGEEVSASAKSDFKQHSDRKKKQSSSERLQRSRERNRMHARKTRQRKKEHMKVLKERADSLKQEHLKLKQAISEKNTANILLVMCSSSKGGSSTIGNPKVDELMKRATEDIPDASKITELPTLYLPGHHSQGKKRKGAGKPHGSTSGDKNGADVAVPTDDIDYNLLSKDRAKCSPAELDRIRRERNRMHAKRTRDRKRLFMEEMEGMIKQLEEENLILQNHLQNLDSSPDMANTCASPQLQTPETNPQDRSAETDPSPGVITNDNLKKLLAVAISDEARVQSATSTLAESVATNQTPNLSGDDNSMCNESVDQKSNLDNVAEQAEV